MLDYLPPLNDSWHSQLEADGFMVTTTCVAIPTGIKVLDWTATLWKGKIRLQAPMIFAFGAIAMFLFAGITEIMMASVPIDIHANNTYFVVGHFHYIAYGTLTMGLFAAIYHWFPKMTGRMYNEGLGQLLYKVHDGRPYLFLGDIAVLACGAVNSAAILLRSRSDVCADGLANCSGLVGRNYMKYRLTALVQRSPKTNWGKFQRSVCVNDFYWGTKDFAYPMVHIHNMGGLLQNIILAESPRILSRLTQW